MKKAIRAKISAHENETDAYASWWLEDIPKTPTKKYDWTISKSESRDKTSSEIDPNWNLRWATHEYWEAAYIFQRIEPDAVKWRRARERRARLIEKGFRPREASGEVSTLQKVHPNKILRETHSLKIDGKHDRSLEIMPGAESHLDRLTREITDATNEALAENKRDKNYRRSVPAGIRWRAEEDEDQHPGLSLKANKKLRALMKKNWPFICAFRVYDPLSPIPAFSLAPLRSASHRVRKSYLQFLTAVTLADEIIERAGGPKGTRALTPEEQKRAEEMRRRWQGTAKGSTRMIASEIGLEMRGYSDRKWKEKGPALIQDVKRHFRRKGLIRRK